MGSLLVGCFALIGLAVVLISAVCFWVEAATHPTAVATRQLEALAAEAKAALRRIG